MRRVLLFVTGLLCACEQVETVPATQLLITVRSDLGSDIKSVEAQLFDEREQRAGQNYPFVGRSLPFSFAVVPAAKSPDPRVLVVLTAKDGDGQVLAESKALTSFVPRKTVALSLWLLQACRGLVCEPGETCTVTGGTAECTATPIAGVEIDPITKPGTELIELGEGPSRVGDAGREGRQDQHDGATAEDGGSQGLGSPGLDASLGLDGGRADGAPDAGVGADSASPIEPPLADCDDARPCSPGYGCTAGKCVSRCEQTRCDSNATCALTAGAPVCTCNSGFISRTETSGSISCLRDVQCGELGCDTNASCEVGTDQLRRCVCKTGYTGTGMTCAPISCGPLSVLNGAVNTAGGTFGQSATYTCDTGYTKTGGTARRCEVGGWSGTAPSCEPFDCRLPTAPAHGRVTATNGTRFPSGAVRYTCDTGYTISTTTDTRTCGATGWSGAVPSCLGCGDGIVSPTLNEDCDPLNPTDPYACINCRNPRGAYKSCVPSEICPNGLGCFNGYCTVTPCSSPTQCPATPAGLSIGVTCQANFACVLTGCRTASDCPTGLICNSGACGVCSTPDLPCPAGSSCGSDYHCH